MMQAISAKQWAEWIAYNRIEPVDVERTILAELALMFQNVNKAEKSVSMDAEFYLSGGVKVPQPKQVPPENIESHFMSLFKDRIVFDGDNS